MKTLFYNAIVILILGLGFVACGTKEEYYNVPKELNPVYKVGDTLFYRSGNKYDTFCFTSSSVIDHEMDKQYHYQEIMDVLINKNYPELNKTSTCIVDFYYSSVVISWLGCSFKLNYNEIPSNTNFTINNFTYSNIYELTDTSSVTNPYLIKKLYFNYKYWVVRYVRNDSTIWDLIQH